MLPNCEWNQDRHCVELVVTNSIDNYVCCYIYIDIYYNTCLFQLFNETIYSHRKGKRTSIPEHVSHIFKPDNLIVKTYNTKNVENKVECRATNTNIEKPRDLNWNIVKPTSERGGGTPSRAGSSKQKGEVERSGRSSAPQQSRPRPASASASASPDLHNSDNDRDRASSHDNHSSAHTSSSQLTHISYYTCFYYL